MRLHLNDDQHQILGALDALTRPYLDSAAAEAGLFTCSEALNSELAQSGFLDVMADEDLGAVTAALVAEKLARLPQAIEAGASALVRPALDIALRGPVCLVEPARLARPIRFLRPDAAVIVVDKERVRSFTARSEMIEPASADSLYAYPVAFLKEIPADARTHDLPASEAIRLWRVALSAELSGLMAAALENICGYLAERKQFGRPLATFQALRHRLAELQVAINGLYWMAMKAAGSEDGGDAAMAALLAQETAKRAAYDFHQLMGGMGMTLEHPMHLWTYRMKLLTAELGGSGAQALAAADAIWG